MKSSNGIRITQAGIDARFAADYQYVFNSDWPSLAIAFDQVITVKANSIGKVTHGLGFFPLTMAWFSINGVSVGRFYGGTSFDKQNVYIDNSYSSTDVTVDIKCYNVDISTSQDYALPKPPNFKTNYDPSIGIKVVKYGKSIISTDLRDFILHSRAQSPAILVIKTQVDGFVGGGSNSISYVNPANYTPWVLGFICPFGDNTTYQCYPPGGNQSSPAFFQLGTKSVIRTAGTTGNGSLVVLRDPLVIPTSTRVIYG